MSTIIKIINANDGFDYYVSFNGNSDINSGATDGINKVLITRKQTGYSNADSFLIGSLDSLQRFDLSEENFQIYPYPLIDTYPYYAGIQVIRYSSYNLKDNCLMDESLLSIHLRTGDFPSSDFWTVKNLESDINILSNGYYKDPNTLYTSNTCISDGHYKFSLISTENTTSTIYSEYNVTVGEVVLYQGNTSEWEYLEISFVTCSSDNVCNDYDGCTRDFCDGGLCVNIQNEDGICSDCRWLTIGEKD